MTPFTQQVFDHARSIFSNENDIAKLQDAIRLAQEELARLLAAKTCQNEDCGENLNDHRGYDAACPHPKRFIAGNPLYIEGQYFRGGEL